MPFTTEISNIKTEINAGLAASQYTAKDLVYVSKAIEALSNAESQLGTFNQVDIQTILYVGSTAQNFEASAVLTNPIAVFESDETDYSQIAFRNKGTSANSSTDLILYTNNGDDNHGWIDMGITSSNFADPSFTITGKGDGYIFVSGATGGDDRGNLVLATDSTGSQNKIIFAAGGLASNNTQMVITPNQNVHIEIPTPSTSATTGALTVVGGVGIQGDMNVQGNVAIQGTITFGGGGTTVETANLAVTDPAVFVGTNNQADIVDLSFIGEYATTVSPISRTITNKALTSNVATLTTSAAHTYLAGDVVTVTGVDATFNGTFNIIAVPTSTTFTYAKTATNVTSVAASGTATVNARRKFAGIARDASDGVIKAFRDATTKPISTVNFSEAGLTFAPFKAGALEVSSATIGSVTNTEIGYLSGVTSAIQTQINAKASSAGPTFTGNVVLPSTTSIGDVDSTEIGYLNGVSSNIQTQIDAKLSSSSAASTYAPLIQTPDSSKVFSSNNYTLVSGDKDKILLLSNAGTAGTVTVPSGIFATGSVITIVQTGTGQLTLTQSGTTINSQGSKLKLNGQYASCQLICTGSNTFLAIGNLVA